jgi:UDP-N-acetylmuramoyl-L-alanyl-D-glutamate--2,6-diaminopimelate ligase
MDFLGYLAENIQTGLKNVTVPGRFQSVKTTLPFTVIIDYAHTDDALKNVLETIRNLKPNRIISVFGCGGDRETGKRFLMGEISSRMADITIITSDNPRTEDPERILDMIEEGVKRADGKYIRIINREDAIKHSIDIANDNDIVLIAGKGHEDYQILKDRTIHFDDTEVAEKYLREREII